MMRRQASQVPSTTEPARAQHTTLSGGEHGSTTYLEGLAQAPRPSKPPRRHGRDELPGGGVRGVRPDPRPEHRPDDGGQTPGPQPEAIALPGVQVGAQRARSYLPSNPGLFRLTDNYLDIPQSMTIVTQDLMREQAAFNLRDALRNVTGISLQAGEGGGGQGDNLSLRGFPARTDIFLDGIRDVGQYNRDVFNLEQVDVLKGPSAVYFGRGSTGGVINQVSKTPQAERFYDGTLSGGNGPLGRGTIDFNQPSATPWRSASTGSPSTTSLSGATTSTSSASARRRRSPGASARPPWSRRATTTTTRTISRTAASRSSRSPARSAGRPTWTRRTTTASCSRTSRRCTCTAAPSPSTTSSTTTSRSTTSPATSGRIGRARSRRAASSSRSPPGSRWGRSW